MIVCSISKIPLKEGDDIVFIPLKKNEFKNSFKVNNSPVDTFTPKLLPFFGKYSEMYNIVEIERTPHITMLEKTFNTSIDKIVSIISDNYTNNPFTEENLKTLGFVFEKKDGIYKYFFNKEKYLGLILNDTENGKIIVYNEIVEHEFTNINSIESLLFKIFNYFSIDILVEDKFCFLEKDFSLMNFMIVKREIYDNFSLIDRTNLSSPVRGVFLEKLGFKITNVINDFKKEYSFEKNDKENFTTYSFTVIVDELSPFVEIDGFLCENMKDFFSKVDYPFDTSLIKDINYNKIYIETLFDRNERIGIIVKNLFIQGMNFFDIEDFYLNYLKDNKDLSFIDDFFKFKSFIYKMLELNLKFDCSLDYAIEDNKEALKSFYLHCLSLLEEK